MGHAWFVHVTTGPPVTSVQKQAELGPGDE